MNASAAALKLNNSNITQMLAILKPPKQGHPSNVDMPRTMLCTMLRVNHMNTRSALQPAGQILIQQCHAQTQPDLAAEKRTPTSFQLTICSVVMTSRSPNQPVIHAICTVDRVAQHLSGRGQDHCSYASAPLL